MSLYKPNIRFYTFPYIEMEGEMRFNRLNIDKPFKSNIQIDYFLFQAINLVGRKKYVYLDVEYRQMRKGKATCNNLWHVDGTPNQSADSVSVVLYVDKFPTEFIVTPVNGSGRNTKEFSDSLVDYHSIRMPCGSLVVYDGHTIHRGVFADDYGFRRRLRYLTSEREMHGTRYF